MAQRFYVEDYLLCLDTLQGLKHIDIEMGIDNLIAEWDRDLIFTREFSLRF
jgi:hypothetical protein